MGLISSNVAEWTDEEVLDYLRQVTAYGDFYEADFYVKALVLREFFKRGLDESDEA